MDVSQPNVKIGQKMANGQLLFLALWVLYHYESDKDCTNFPVHTQ